MDLLAVERMDHLGVLTGVIKDLGLIEGIDQRIGRHKDEKISCGEAVAGMILNGLGFSDRPLTLAPQFFDNCPTALLVEPGALPEHFNRFKLGRALDDVHAYGSDILFAELARDACAKEGVETRIKHLDTSSFTLTGDYQPDSDTKAVTITHGYSKDHRPDLKQVVLELIVSQDGGVPLFSKSWDGNTSDNEVFQARAKALVEEFKKSNEKQYLLADSKLYSESNASNLSELHFITRVPESISLVSHYIDKALAQADLWQPLSESRKVQVFEVDHYGIKQRWCVVFSNGARDRSETTMARRLQKEKDKLEKELFHLGAQRFSCEPDARKELAKLEKKWKYHKAIDAIITEHRKHAGKGRPKTGAEPTELTYQITAKLSVIEESVVERIEHGSCYVVATNIPSSELSHQEVVENYSSQQTVERGFRFLKDPVFFVSSLFVKKPSRVQGLLMVMTLALLVYAIAERRLRRRLAETETTLPNQIKQETSRPTLRWIFQLLTGINRIKISLDGVDQYVWNGLNDLRQKILRLFGETVMQIYGLS